jgi:hypothetical protein
MILLPEELQEFKQLYFRHYHARLSDQMSTELGTRLVTLFEVVAKPIPKVDIGPEPLQNAIRKCKLI